MIETFRDDFVVIIAPESGHVLPPVPGLDDRDQDDVGFILSRQGAQRIDIDVGRRQGGIRFDAVPVGDAEGLFQPAFHETGRIAVLGRIGDDDGPHVIEARAVSQGRRDRQETEKEQETEFFHEATPPAKNQKLPLSLSSGSVSSTCGM